MTPTTRAEILQGIQSMCRLFPSFRLCQMVANVGHLAQGRPDADLARVGDKDFLATLRDMVQRREERLEGETPEVSDTDTLPPCRLIRGPPASLAASSRATPSQAASRQTRARIAAACSPIPAVNTSASRPGPPAPDSGRG